jgi:hypothetical protein
MKTIQLLLPLVACAAVFAFDPLPAQESGRDDRLAPAAPPEFNALEMLRLRDGRVLWGEIESHDSAGCVVRRLDTFGRVQLEWSLLDPALGLELQRRFGYVEFEQEELMVDAAIITLVDGSVLTGVIEQTTPDAFHVKSRTGLLILPRERVDGALVTTSVPARDVYSREELYATERARHESALAAGGADAIAANLALALHCERILDFVKALEHYEAAKALGSKGEELDAQIAAAGRKAEAQSQVDALDQIDRLRRQDKFIDALRELAVFPQAWPASPLMEEWAKLNQRVLSDREKKVLREVREQWFVWLGRATRDAAKEMGFEQAMAWAEEGLPQFLLAQVTADVQKIWPEASQGDVRDLLARREGVRTRYATYGLGTFLLGRERATARPDEEEKEAEANPISELERQRAEIQKRVERFLQDARARSGGNASETEIDPEVYWQSWPVQSRAMWLTAFYAEFGGDLEMRRVTLEPHADCGGTGYLEEISTTAGGGGFAPRLVPDPGCNGIGVKRRISYR